MSYRTAACRAVVGSLAVLSLATALPAQDPSSRELMRLEDQWAAASMKRDAATVERMLSDDFLSYSDKGIVTTKAKLVAKIANDGTVYVSGGNSGYQVKLHGTTGVIIGTFVVTMKGPNGNETHRFAWTDTWMKQADGYWLCIASQSVQVK